MSFYGVHPVSEESVSAVTATPSVDLGTIRAYAGELYRYVYAAQDVNKNYLALLTGTSGYTVAATGAVSGHACVGVAKHATIPSGSYGWLMFKGVADVKNGMASTAPVKATDNVYMATDGCFFSKTTVITNAVSDGHVVGTVLSAGASGGTGASMSLLYVNV